MIKIGVSACLLGKNVRYDGGNKFINLKKYFDSETYDLCGICPEVEMGMSTPRKPIRIVNHKNQIRLVQVENSKIDYTSDMSKWFKKSLDHLSQYQGFILKSKSPSCGYQTTKHYLPTNQVKKLSNGLFVSLLNERFSNLTIIDESNLNQPILLTKFKNSLGLS